MLPSEAVNYKTCLTKDGNDCGGYFLATWTTCKLLNLCYYYYYYYYAWTYRSGCFSRARLLLRSLAYAPTKKTDSIPEL